MLLIISDIGVHLIIIVLHILMILIECLGELFAIFFLLNVVLFQYLGEVNLDLLLLFFKLVHGQFV